MDFRTIDENLRGAMRVFARATQGGESRRLPGVELVASGVDYPVFNAALLTSPVPARDGDLDRRVAAAKVYFGARSLRWSCWICTDWLDGRARRKAKDILAARGLRLLVEAPGMAAETLAPPARPLPELDYRPIADTPTRLAFCHIASVAFSLPFAVTEQVYASARVWGQDFTGHIGYLAGEPVTMAATVCQAGVIGVYSVATLPPHERRGYGEAVTRHAIDAARRATGLDHSVLQATRRGLPLYERMGYRTVTTFSIYVSD